LRRIAVEHQTFRQIAQAGVALAAQFHLPSQNLGPVIAPRQRRAIAPAFNTAWQDTKSTHKPAKL
jgi:hypothetical protein